MASYFPSLSASTTVKHKQALRVSRTGFRKMVGGKERGKESGTVSVHLSADAHLRLR